jgi:putative pyruvate formate lyase activating enzyme
VKLREDWTPRYVELAASGELERRAAEARELLGPRCVVCPRGCKVDRRADVAGLCAIGRHAVVASYFAHFGEEDCLRGRRGSGTIFFSGCNLRCVFCLPPGSLVATERGPRAIGEIFASGIEELRVGEGRARRVRGIRVHTVTGETAPVAKVFRHEYRGELVRVEPLGAPGVRLTPNHELFAARSASPDGLVKVRADELTTEHYLVVPKRLAREATVPSDVAGTLARQPVPMAAEVPVATVEEEGRVRFAGERRPGIAAEVPLDERLAWLHDAGTHVLVPIHRLETEPYDGFVFNLEVDHPTRSYVAPAVAVANCQNHDISWEVRGEVAPPERLAAMMLELQAGGCHNVNVVTPEHVVPQVLEALPRAASHGLRLPLVYNTSGYDALDGIVLLDGVVDVYMPDLKLWTAGSARRYLKRADYPEVARETIREMHRQVGDLVLDERGTARRGVILRHLVMPGLVEETEEILRWVAEELGTGCYVNLMAQYHVSGKVGRDGQYGEIARGIHREEYERALALAQELGLRLDPRSAGERHLLARAR